jgi:hypothetical protein
VLAHDATSPDALWQRLAELVANAAPAGLGPERTVPATLTVLGTPADDDAERLADAVRNLSPNAVFRTVSTTDDIILYQESPVSLAALPHMTFELNPTTNADGRRPLTTHARTDVLWTPIGVQ